MSTISSLSIRNRNDAALQIEKVVNQIKKGKEIENFPVYLNKLQLLMQVADQDLKCLTQRGITAGPVRTELEAHRLLLSRISAITKAIGLISPHPDNPKKTVEAPPNSAQSAAPWEGKLRPGETPLHWAVHNHDYQTALELRARGASIDVENSQHITPVEEAILQKDLLMARLLLIPHTFLDSKTNATFWKRIQEIKQQIAALQAIDPRNLSPTCRAAFTGDLDKVAAATDVNTPDKQGLTPLHYALMGKDPQVIAHLAPRCDPYALTPDKRTYLDYAICSGNGNMYEFFAKRLPFTLGRKEDLFLYLFASGTLGHLLTTKAQAKDPIARGEIETICTTINALWVGGKVISYLGNPTSMLGSMGASIANMFAMLSSPLSVQKAFELMPPSASKIFQLYYLAQFAYIILGSLSKIAGNPLGEPPEWKGLIPTVAKSSEIAGSFLSKGYAGLQVLGASQSLIRRAPQYVYSLGSRPFEVLQNFAQDAFHVASQLAIALV